MDPFEESTTAKWMKITEKEYDALYDISMRTGKCVKFDCTTMRKNREDLLCPVHRKEYNAWSQQFFKINGQKEIGNDKQ